MAERAYQRADNLAALSKTSQKLKPMPSPLLDRIRKTNATATGHRIRFRPNVRLDTSQVKGLTTTPHSPLRVGIQDRPQLGSYGDRTVRYVPGNHGRYGYPLHENRQQRLSRNLQFKGSRVRQSFFGNTNDEGKRVGKSYGRYH